MAVEDIELWGLYGCGKHLAVGAQNCRVIHPWGAYSRLPLANMEAVSGQTNLHILYFAPLLHIICDLFARAILLQLLS